MTWEEICADPVLDGLPYRIELNRWGNVEMSRLDCGHGEREAEVGSLLHTHTAGGVCMIACPIETAENTKVADVAWVSLARRRANSRGAASYAMAPEICAEVLTRDDAPEEMMHKGRLYLQAGASEFWLCDARGELSFFNADGWMGRSRLCPRFPARVVIPD